MAKHVPNSTVRELSPDNDLLTGSMSMTRQEPPLPPRRFCWTPPVINNGDRHERSGQT